MKSSWLVLPLLAVVALPVLAEDLIETGGTKYLQGDLQGAISDWLKFAEQNPGNPTGLDLAGNALIVAGKESLADRDYDTGIDALRKALGVFPNHKEVRSLAMLAELEGNFMTSEEPLPATMTDAAPEKSEIAQILFSYDPQRKFKARQEMKEEKKPEEPPKPEDKKEEEKPKQEKPKPTTIVHVSTYGETLATIAIKYYHDASKWERIWRKNPDLKNPHRLFPGTKLIIPLPAAAPQPKKQPSPAVGE